MIELMIFDIDGVLTDGSILVNSQGQEQKRVNIKDIDAVFELKRRGYRLAAVTGEQTEIVDYFRGRLPWDQFLVGCKKKLEAVRQLAQDFGLSMEQVAYIGDGKYDLEVLPHVGLSVCPADAIREARLQADVVLSRAGGDGCIWELLSIMKTDRQPESPARYLQDRMAEHQLIFKKMASDQELAGSIMAVGQAIVERLRNGGQLFLCGNGGSAADAQHIAAEFVGKFYQERPALQAEALTTNTSILTAIGNDYGYERIFVRQLEAKAHANDVLIGISTSGSSSNVLEVLRYGKQQGLLTVMLTGETYPAELDDLCGYVLNIPSRITPRIQEAHIFLGHLWAEFVENSLYGGRDHETDKSF